MSNLFGNFPPQPPPNPVEAMLAQLKHDIENNISQAYTPFSRLLILQLSRENVTAFKNGLVAIESWLDDCINTERLV